MGLETAAYLNDLVTTNPDGAVDPKSQGDDHLRLLKSVLKSTFPGLGGRYRRVQVSAGAFTVAVTDNASIIRLTSGVAVNLLPAASAGNGFENLIYNNSTGNVTLTPNGAEKVNGQASVIVPPENIALVLCQNVATLEYVALVIPLVAVGGAGADITGNISLTAADINGGTRRITASAVVTLPPIAGVPIGRQITLKSVTTGDVTWTPNAAETADGISGAVRIPSYRSFTLFANGSDWVIMEEPDTYVGELRPLAAGVSPPKGWVLADKSSLLRTTYAGLFAVLGVTWGNVDGTHFNAPDVLGRSLMGDGAGSGLTARTVGQTPGEENHVLTINEIPSHNHPGSTFGNGSTGPGNGATNGNSGQPQNGVVNVGAQGGGAGHNVIHPVSVARFIVKT